VILQLLEVIGILFVVGLSPALLLRGIAPETPFLAPLIGSIVAGFAAMVEFAAGGTLILWFIILGIFSNALPLVCLAWMRTHAGQRASHTRELQRLRDPRPTSRTLSRRSDIAGPVVIFLVVGAGAFWPLQALRLPYIGYDANSIWIMHALLISGGHKVFFDGIRNPAYSFSNPDYPPLVSATGAISIIIGGRTDLDLAAAATAVLNSCALGVIGSGIARMTSRREHPAGRVTSTLAGGVIGLAGFAFAGIHGVSGYADLLWSATAAGSVLFGLVLPMSWRNGCLAWLLAIAAALTKNEGMVMAPVLLGLLTLRYVAARHVNAKIIVPDNRLTRVKSKPPPMVIQDARVRWVLRVALAGILTLPAVVWPAITLVRGVGNAFFSSGVHSPVSRVAPILGAMADHLVVLPVVGVVAGIGALSLSRIRQRMSLAGAGWLWVAVLAWVVALFATYDLGSLPIHWWLDTSITRTVIFLELTVSVDVAVWGVVAITRLLTRVGNTTGNGVLVPRPASTRICQSTAKSLTPLELPSVLSDGSDVT